MLKRFVGTKSGKKQNKSGVILVTILFILAVAFVLIGAALMMTANTRKRLYSFAEGGQARITCTAAAQLFQSALEEQQIRDSQFKDLCDAGTVVPLISWLRICKYDVHRKPPQRNRELITVYS